MKYISLVILVGFLLSGCATPYQKAKTPGFGFYDKKITDNRYIIAFAANGFTSMSKVKDFILLRSSEVAIGNQFQCFVISKTTRYTGNPNLQIENRTVLVWTLESEVGFSKSCPEKTDKIFYNANSVKNGVESKYKNDESLMEMLSRI